MKHKVLNSLNKNLTEVKIIEITGNGYEDNYFDSYASACGIYVNSLVTKNYIYVPIFNNEYDDEALKIIKNNTDKNVIAVDAKKIAFLGGSVRCLSWQLTGENANKLIKAARAD